MRKSIYENYAKLLVNYSLKLKKGDKLLISSTYLAEPLIQEVYREALKNEIFVESDIKLRNMTSIFYKYAGIEQLKFVSPVKKYAYENFDAILFIYAHFNTKELQNVPSEKQNIVNEAHKEINKIRMKRGAEGSLNWTICEFPTEAGAQECGMSLREYEDFIFSACHLYDESPVKKWREVREFQQKIVDYFNNCENFQYKGPNVDITFNTRGRTWMNSDGCRNMPSGEVFTSPVEDSVNGKITFTYPLVYRGVELKNISLEVKDGEVIKWDSDTGRKKLDEIFAIPGAKRFGEAAVGTNEDIKYPIKNGLFDEKIGGSIHMAIGASYFDTGGKNECSIHLDLITDMKDNGKIYADGKLVYKSGKFLI